MLITALWAAAPGASGHSAASDQPPGGANELPRGNEIASNDRADLRTRLSGGTFDQRQRAMWDLWRDRGINRDAVRAAAGDADPEVSSRAQWILDRWRRGILPETPVDLARRLEAVSHAESLQRLLDFGLFQGARVAIEEAAEAGDRATLDRTEAVVQRSFPFYVRMADQQGQLAELAELVDLLATTAPMIICRNQLRELLDWDGEQERAWNAATLALQQQQQIAVISLAAANQLDAATAVARQADDPELLRVCQMLAGDWTGLAAVQREAAGQAVAGSAQSDRHWAYALVAAARSGDATLREQAVAALSRREGDTGADAAEDPSVSLRWQVLAMHGEIDAAVEILTPTQPLVAAELLAQAGRLDEAMMMIDLAPADVDSRLDDLLTSARSATAEVSATRVADVPQPVQRLITAGRLLVQAGRRDAAWQLLAAMAAEPEEDQNGSFAIARALVLQAILRLNRTDWLIRLVTQQSANGFSPADRHFLARAMDVRPETLDALLAVVGDLLPGGDLEASRAVIDLLQGEVPPSFDAHQDYRKLYELLTTRSPRVIRRNARVAPHRPGPTLNLEIVKLFEKHGQIDVAKRSLVHLASQGDMEASLELANVELKAGQVQVARALYEAIWQRVDQQRRDPERLHRAEDDALIAMRAILGEATAAARMGDQEQAQHLWWLIDLMTCTPSAKLRENFGSHLLDQGYDSRAERIYRVLVPWMAFGSDEGVEFYAVARNFHRAVAESDPQQAAEGLDLAIAATIESTVFYPGAYLSLPAYVHRNRILAAIEYNDHDAIRRHVTAVMRLNPIDIEFGEKVVAQLRTAGMGDLADEIIESIYLAGRKHLDQFPLDIVTANNLAWILALADHRLEEAHALARRAVYFAPDSTVYRDTLAEVLFRLGHDHQAIAIERACLLDDPGQWHLHEQLRRFEAAQND